MSHLRQFLHAGHTPTLFASFLYFDTGFMVWVLLGVLGNFIGPAFGLAPGELALLVATPVLSAAIIRPFLGVAADRFGGRRMGLVGMGVTLFALALGYLVSGQGPLLVSGILLGFAGASFAIALPLASRWYPPEHQGLAMGIAGAGNSGPVVTSLLAPRLAEAFGWQSVFLFAMIPVALTAVVFAVLARDSPRRDAPKSLRDYGAVFRKPDTVWFMLFYAITFGGFVGLASYSAIFFRAEYGLSRVNAGDLTAMVVVAGSFARPVGGLLADRLGGAKMLTALLAVAGVSFAFLGLAPPLPVGAGLVFVGMGLLGMGNGALFQLVPQMFQKEIGLVTGLIGSAGSIGGFLLPLALGYGRGITGSYAVGFLAFGAAAVMGAAFLILLRQRWHFRMPRLAAPAAAPRPIPAE